MPIFSIVDGESGSSVRAKLNAKLGPIIDVKADCGAAGDGSTDDRAAIQAAFEAAFGTAASPNGASNAKSNRAVFFPNGNYIIGSPGIVLPPVRGAHIFGAGRGTATLTASSTSVPTKLFTTNGMDFCHIQNIKFFGAAASSGNRVTFEADWDGTSSHGVGLEGNIFTNCQFERGDYALRVGLSGNGGAGFQFYGCHADTDGAGIAAVTTWSDGAVMLVWIGGGAGSSQTAFWIRNGQISQITDVGMAGSTVQDILVETHLPVLIKGCRTESELLCKITDTSGLVVIEATDCNSGFSPTYFCNPAGTSGGAQSKVILDSCRSQAPTAEFCSDAAAEGKIYVRGCQFASGFFDNFNGDFGQGPI